MDSYQGVITTEHGQFTLHLLKRLRDFYLKDFLLKVDARFPILLDHASQESFQNNNEILREVETLFLKFLDFKNKVRNGELGETAQFLLSFTWI